MPGTQSTKSAPDSNQSQDVQDTRTLIDAINLSLRYGNEYMNEMPLVGEPGNFRLSKIKDAASLLPPNATQTPLPIFSRQISPSLPPKAASPPPPPPPIQTDVPPVSGKKSGSGKSAERTPATPGSGQKPKRRKSKVAIKFDEVATPE